MSKKIKIGDLVVRKKDTDTPGWISIKEKFERQRREFPTRFQVSYITGNDVYFVDFLGIWSTKYFELAPAKKPKKYL